MHWFFCVYRFSFWLTLFCLLGLPYHYPPGFSLGCLLGFSINGFCFPFVAFSKISTSSSFLSICFYIRKKCYSTSPLSTRFRPLLKLIPSVLFWTDFLFFYLLCKDYLSEDLIKIGYFIQFNIGRFYTKDWSFFDIATYATRFGTFPSSKLFLIDAQPLNLHTAIIILISLLICFYMKTQNVYISFSFLYRRFTNSFAFCL